MIDSMSLTVENCSETLEKKYHDSNAHIWSILEETYGNLEVQAALFFLFIRVEANNTRKKTTSTNYIRKDNIKLNFDSI